MDKFKLINKNKFTDGSLTLGCNMSVPIKIIKRAGMHFAENEVLEVFSFGMTEEQCLEDFDRIVIKNWLYYTERANFFVKNFDLISPVVPT